MKISIDNPSYNSIESHYKHYESNLKKLINIVKKDYYNRQFVRYKNDIKNTWSTIKSVIDKNRSQRKNIQTKFKINGSIIEGDLKIADEFNKFFMNIGPSLASKITPPNNRLVLESYLSSDIRSEFSFDTINQDDILKIITNFKNKSSAGVDEFNAIFIKKIKAYIVAPLTSIISQSLHTGIFPNKLKIA